MAYKTLTITNAGSEGINSDIAPYNLPVESITSGKNFRIAANSIESVGSYENWSQMHTSEGEWLYDIGSPNPDPSVGRMYKDTATDEVKINKTALSSLDLSELLESLVVGDTLTMSFDTWTITAIVDNGTWMSFIVDSTSDGSAATESPVMVNRVELLAHVRPVSVSSGNFWIVAGRNSVYVFDGDTDPVLAWTEISSGAYAGIGLLGEFDWTSCMLGSIPILNNQSHFPEYWSPQATTQVLQALEFSAGVTFESATISCKVIRSHKNFLFALNLTEGGVELPSSYRWSHPSDNNGLPFTWDEDDLSAIAGKAQIGGDSGELLDGRSLRDSFVLYSQRAINLLEYTGDEFVWHRTEMESSIGLLNRNSITEVKGVHYFIGDGDIYINDGNSVDSILHSRIRKRFNSRVNAAYFDRSYVIKNIALKEVWFCVPEDGSEYPNTAFVFNWKDKSWAIQSLPANIAHSDYGAQSEPSDTYADFDDAPEITYDSFAGVPYGTQNRTPLDGAIIGVNHVDDSLKVLDPSITTVTDDIDSQIERISIPIEGNIGVVTVVRVYPHIIGTEPVSIQIGSQEHSGGVITWNVAKNFDPSSERKLDVRVTGKLFSWRISSIGTGQFSYSGMDLEYASAGLR